jgi:hypothetical protein
MLMSSEQLAGLLRDIADRVERGDSYAGSLQYALPVVPWIAGLEVEASIRVGNLMGQGSIILIGPAERNSNTSGE